MKNTKKIVALLLALVMILCIFSAVYAAESQNSTDKCTDRNEYVNIAYCMHSESCDQFSTDCICRNICPEESGENCEEPAADCSPVRKRINAQSRTQISGEISSGGHGHSHRRGNCH